MSTQLKGLVDSNGWEKVLVRRVGMGMHNGAGISLTQKVIENITTSNSLRNNVVMTREQARILRDRLNEFLEGIEEADYSEEGND